MVTLQKSSQRSIDGLADGDYEVTLGGHKFAMKLITRRHDPVENGQEQSRVLMVISSSKWFRKTGRRWSGFAFYDPPGNLYVWHKFRGNKKRGRSWDLLAEAFRNQVIAPFMGNDQQLFKCCGDFCPGYPYRASEFSHPYSCVTGFETGKEEEEWPKL